MQRQNYSAEMLQKTKKYNNVLFFFFFFFFYFFFFLLTRNLVLWSSLLSRMSLMKDGAGSCI
jgi:hypothetical protein